MNRRRLVDVVELGSLQLHVSHVQLPVKARTPTTIQTDTPGAGEHQAQRLPRRDLGEGEQHHGAHDEDQPPVEPLALVAEPVGLPHGLHRVDPVLRGRDQLEVVAERASSKVGRAPSVPSTT